MRSARKQREPVHHLEPEPDRVFGIPGLYCHECCRVFIDLDDHELMRDLFAAERRL